MNQFPFSFIQNAQAPAGPYNFPGTTATYGMAGYDGSILTNIQKLPYSTETFSSLGASLGTSAFENAAGKSTLKGYIAGNYTISGIIQALTFSGETTSTLSATLPTSVQYASGSSSNDKMYTFGGQNGGNNNGLTVIQALTFSGETTASLSATLSQKRGNGDNSVSGPTKGYMMGGVQQGPSGDTQYTEVTKFTYATEVAATSGNSLSTATGFGTCASYTTKGYLFGGQTGTGGTYLNTCISVTYSGDTIATVSSTLTTAVTHPGGSSSTTKGYVMGGDTGSGFTSTCYKMPFATETIANLGSNLGSSRFEVNGVQY